MPELECIPVSVLAFLHCGFIDDFDDNCAHVPCDAGTEPGMSALQSSLCAGWYPGVWPVTMCEGIDQPSCTRLAPYQRFYSCYRVCCLCGHPRVGQDFVRKN